MKTSVNSVTVRVLLFRLVLQISSVGGRQGLASVSYWDVCECGHAWRGKKTEEGTEAFWSFTLRCSLGRIYDWHAAQTFITAVPLPGHPGQISKAPPPGENQPLCSLPARIPLNLNHSFKKNLVATGMKSRTNTLSKMMLLAVQDYHANASTVRETWR